MHVYFLGVTRKCAEYIQNKKNLNSKLLVFLKIFITLLDRKKIEVKQPDVCVITLYLHIRSGVIWRSDFERQNFNLKKS
jgi:hypothetical protein